MILLIAVMLAGGCGATARVLVDTAVRSRHRGHFPLGTLVVNVSGALLLGVLAGALGNADARLAVAGTGFCGGYTTFSTACFESVALAERGLVSAATLNAVGTLVLTMAAAGAGLAVGHHLL